MKTISSITVCIVLTGIGCTLIFGQQQKGVRKVYDDSTSVLQTWQSPKNEQQYLLSGSKLGLNVGLTFNGTMPTEAKISLGAGKSITVHAVGTRFVTSLFEESGGKITILHDLDSNGSWDARTPLPGNAEIFVDSQWHQVSQLDALSETPKAMLDGIQYEFSGGVWKPMGQNSK